MTGKNLYNRRGGVPIVAAVVSIGALLLSGSPAWALGWTTVASPSDVPGDNYLYGADASGTGNVWAVGVD